MSLPVPLTVRVGDSHVTREVSAVGFRKEAIGGVRNIRLRLARPLDTADVNLAAYSRVYLYDARSAETIAEARISDLGRGAGTSGQQWDIVAFGPAQHASDKQFPYIVIDSSLERWSRSFDCTQNATTQNDERDSTTPSLVTAAEEGKTVDTAWVGAWVYRAIYEAGMKLGRFEFTVDNGVIDANYRYRLTTRPDPAGAGTVVIDAGWSTTATSLAAAVGAGTPITNGETVPLLITRRQTSATTGAEAHWAEFYNITAKALLLNAAGAEITTGVVLAVKAHDVVNDLLGRVLNQFDGASATVDTTAAYIIDQLAYPDGVTAAQVLDDLMILEPAYRWTTGPSDPTTGLYSFEWKAWPTTVRYETVLEDGGSFPQSSQELWNRVLVRWTDAVGRVRNTVRTLACPILDDAGVTRQAILDLGDEVGSATAAVRAGDNFLADHNVPANAGTLTISRPIRDLSTGAMVQPFEIEPGELVRVRGVESSPDSLNASSNDGQTVFRIWSMEYDTDSNTAVLELDTYSRTTANAIARLITRRTRRR